MNDIRERHGIPDARKVDQPWLGYQSLTVTDGIENEVILMIGTATHGAGLCPEQARYIARQLDHSAARIEARIKGAKK